MFLCLFWKTLSGVSLNKIKLFITISIQNTSHSVAAQYTHGRRQNTTYDLSTTQMSKAYKSSLQLHKAGGSSLGTFFIFLHKNYYVESKKNNTKYNGGTIIVTGNVVFTKSSYITVIEARGGH